MRLKPPVYLCIASPKNQRGSSALHLSRRCASSRSYNVDELRYWPNDADWERYHCGRCARGWRDA